MICNPKPLVEDADYNWLRRPTVPPRRINDRNYQLPVLKAVRNALHQILVCRYKNPRIELSPMRFVMDEQTEEDSREVRIEQMSDGYRIMVAMVADIASRLAEANPSDENPLDGKGIVLIDEADLHLHPAWQRKILHDLSVVFRNIQFIVTTHSPLIAMGAADIAQILVFDEKENCMKQKRTFIAPMMWGRF